MLRHIVAAYGKGADQHGALGHGLTNLLDQGAGRYNFTHGSTVNPNAVLAHNLGNFCIIYFAKHLLLKTQGKALFGK